MPVDQGQAPGYVGRMSRTRIALASASVLLGIAGAVIVLKATDGGATRRAAPAAAPTRPGIAVVRAGSDCLVERGGAVVVFQILLRNPAREDQATLLHPALIVRNGPAVSLSSYDRKASLLATEQRTYRIDVRTRRGAHPDRCRVSLGNGSRVSIPAREAS